MPLTKMVSTQLPMARVVVQGYSEETKRFYIRAIVAFRKYMGLTSLIATTHFDVRDYLAYGARRGLIRFTLKHELHALRIFFDFMNMGGLVAWASPRFVKIGTPTTNEL